MQALSQYSLCKQRLLEALGCAGGSVTIVASVADNTQNSTPSAEHLPLGLHTGLELLDDDAFA